MSGKELKNREVIEHALSELAVFSEPLRSESVREVLGWGLECALRRSRDVAGELERFPTTHMYHVVDWIVASLETDAKWLRKVDELGRQRKFLKVMSLGGLFEEAERGFAQMAKNRPKADLWADIKTVVELENGYRLVELTTAALDAESDTMQHCVGSGGYDRAIEIGSTRIYSLRDPYGKPHVTMELAVKKNMIVQIKGKQNLFPDDRYFKMILPWIEKSGFEVFGQELAGGYFLSDGKVRHVSNLKKGERLFGEIVIRMDGHDDLELPEDLEIHGAINIEFKESSDRSADRRSILKFGRNTKVVSPETYHDAATSISRQSSRRHGSVSVRGAIIEGIEHLECFKFRAERSSFQQLPDRLNFPFSVRLNESDVSDLLARAEFGRDLKITSGKDVVLPSGFRVDGDLSIEGYASRVSLGSDVAVAGSLVFNTYAMPLFGSALNESGDETIIVTCGPKLRVGKFLQTGTSSIFIDDGFSIAGSFSARGSSLSFRTGTGKVGGLFWEYVDGVKGVPENLEVEGDIILKGEFSNPLGDRRKIGGNLNLWGSSIKTLPEGLDIAGDVRIGKCENLKMPDTMSVGGSLEVGGVVRLRLHPGVSVGGSVCMRAVKSAEIADGTHIKGCLRIQNMKLERMPIGVVVDDIAELDGIRIDGVTEYFSAHSYALDQAEVVDLVGLDRIAGNLWIDAKDVGKLLPGMVIDGRLIIKGDAPIGEFPPGLKVGERIRFDDGILPEDVMKRMIPERPSSGSEHGPHVPDLPDDYKTPADVVRWFIQDATAPFKP